MLLVNWFRVKDGSQCPSKYIYFEIAIHSVVVGWLHACMHTYIHVTMMLIHLVLDVSCTPLILHFHSFRLLKDGMAAYCYCFTLAMNLFIYLFITFWVKKHFVDVI